MLKMLEGKKTYLSAALLVLLGVAGYWFGLVGPVEAAALASLGFGVFGLGDKSERYGKRLLALLEEIKAQPEKDRVDTLLRRLRQAQGEPAQ
ncbi:MAG: hypothetical protein ACRD2R_03545 [Terriglobales bacterium]